MFLPDSYGYRPGKSALDAVGVTRQRCWKMDWVLEFDIKGLFDNISHKLLMKAVRKHVQDECALLYIERWLTAPMQGRDGAITARDRGTPQGGVISPVLANLFLHYAFDTWMARNFPRSPWCRYADDGLVHCRIKAERKPSRRRCKQGLRNANSKCIPTRPRSSTAKTAIARVAMPVSHLTFWDLPFDRAGQETIKRKKTSVRSRQRPAGWR
ncbi:reverse transcriptase domain-containing protein [Bradyrhizobium sp. USDA 4350]